MFVWLTLFCTKLLADDSDAAINVDLQRIITAAKANDAEVAVNLMYLPVVKAAGGLGAMKKLAEQAKAFMLAKGFKIISYETISPYKKLSTSANDYVIVPAHLVIEVDSHRIDTISYELAIRSHGSTKWEYLDGAAITDEMRSRYFPDLNGTALPEMKTKILN